jgi:hypothetical protein
MVWNKEMLYHHWFSTLLGRSRRNRWDWNEMGQSSFWLTLMMWIYREITDPTKKNTETIIHASKEVSLEIDIEKTEYMLVAILSPECRSKSGLKNSKQIVWKCVAVQIFEDASNNKSLIQEEMRRRMNSGNACYHSVQNFLFSRLLSKNFTRLWFCLWFCMGVKLGLWH